jgi:DHA1 family tetracycline resistance protein-like MFS transporter
MADELWMLFAARFFAGAGSGTVGAVFAYVTDTTTPETRAKGMGVIGAAFGLGFTLGPAFGGLLTGSQPSMSQLGLPAYVAAAFSLAAFFLALFFLKESLPAASRHAPKPPSRFDFARRIVFHRPALRRLVVIGFITTSAFAALESTFALWSRETFDWGPRQIGLMFFYVGAILVVIQGGLIGPLTRRFGETRLLIASTVLLFAGMAAIPFLTSVPPLAVINIALAGGMALFGPSSNSLISREAAIDERGGVLGVSQSTQSLARVIGPLAAGPLFTELGRNAPYWVAAAAMAVAALLAFGLMRRAPAEAPAS